MDIGERNMKLASAGDDIKTWSLESQSLIRSYNPHDHSIPAICWSHDNIFLVSGSPFSSKISICYLKNQPPIELPYEHSLTCLDLNSTSRYLVCGNKEMAIDIWDLNSRKIKKTYKNHKSPVTSVQFNPSDTYIASGSENGEIILHNVMTGTANSPMLVPGGSKVHEVRYSKSRKSLLGSASDDGVVNLWDANTRQLIHKFREHRAPAMGLKFSPINEILLMSGGLDKRINLLDVHSRTAIKTINVEAPVTAVDMMSDGATIAAGTTRGQIYLFDLRKAAVPIGVLTSHKSAILSLRFENEVKQRNTFSSSVTKSSILNNTPIEPPGQGSPNIPTAETATPVRDDPQYARFQKDNSLEAFSPLSQRGRDSLESRDSWAPDRSHSSNMDSQEVRNCSNLALSPLAGDFSHHSVSRHSTSFQSNASLRSVNVEQNHNVSIPVIEVTNETQASGTSGDVINNSSSLNKSLSKDCSASSPGNDSTPTMLPPTNFRSVDGNFQMEFVRNLVRDAVEDFRDEVHRDIVNLQVEMLRQFHIQQNEINSLLQRYSVNEELVTEVERLRAENQRLKANF